MPDVFYIEIIQVVPDRLETSRLVPEATKNIEVHHATKVAATRVIVVTALRVWHLIIRRAKYQLLVCLPQECFSASWETENFDKASKTSPTSCGGRQPFPISRRVGSAPFPLC